MSRFTLTIACLLSIGIAAPVHAVLLGVDLKTLPDIASGVITVSYDATTDTFVADGFAMVLVESSGVAHDILDPADSLMPGHFNITATVNAAGVATGGSLTVEGDVLGFGPTLLTADLVAFGFEEGPGADLFDFLFTLDGGDLAGTIFPGSGSVVGVVLNAFFPSSPGGDFTADFENIVAGGIGFGVADIHTPAPAAVWLAVIGLGLARRAKRRQA